MAEAVPKLVVFDFDGTLVQSNALKTRGFDDMAAELTGGPDALALARKTPGLDRFGIAEVMAEHLGLGAKGAARLVDRYSALVDTAVARAPEVPGAEALCRGLRQAGILVHLSSATPCASLVPIVAARGWTGLFDGLHGRPQTKQETLRALMAEHDLRPSQVLVVGDGPDDRASAEAVGAAFAAVGDRLADAARVTLPDLARLLLGETAL